MHMHAVCVCMCAHVCVCMYVLKCKNIYFFCSTYVLWMFSRDDIQNKQFILDVNWFKMQGFKNHLPKAQYWERYPTYHYVHCGIFENGNSETQICMLSFCQFGGSLTGLAPD